MRLSVLLACLAVPLLALAQDSANNTQATTTAAPSTTQSGSSGNGTATGSASITGTATISGNSTGNATSSANATTPLPTAATTIAGENGGGPNGGAPSPGQSASGGIYGPPDGYIAAAAALRSAALLGFVGFAVGAFVLI